MMNATTPAPAAGPRFDLPTIEPETQPFWDAAKAGQLMLGKCGGCGKVHYYPRPMCPHCWSEDVALTPASGAGVLYTWSTVFVNDLPPFKAMLPYVAAQVDLAEGVRITTNMIDCDPADLSIGMPVTLAFRDLTDEIAVPVFRPATA
jgi:uncharacterized protein